MELATLRTLYFATLFRERARNRQTAEVARALPVGDVAAPAPGSQV